MVGGSLTLFSLLRSTRHDGTLERATAVFGFFAPGRLGLASWWENHALNRRLGASLLLLARRMVQGNADNHGISHTTGDVSLITDLYHQIMRAGKIANRKVLPRTQASQTKRVRWTVLCNGHLIHFGLRIYVEALGFIVLQIVQVGNVDDHRLIDQRQSEIDKTGQRDRLRSHGDGVQKYFSTTVPTQLMIFDTIKAFSRPRRVGEAIAHVIRKIAILVGS